MGLLTPFTETEDVEDYGDDHDSDNGCEVDNTAKGKIRATRKRPLEQPIPSTRELRDKTRKVAGADGAK